MDWSSRKKRGEEFSQLGGERGQGGRMRRRGGTGTRVGGDRSGSGKAETPKQVSESQTDRQNTLRTAAGERDTLTGRHTGGQRTKDRRLRAGQPVGTPQTFVSRPLIHHFYSYFIGSLFKVSTSVAREMLPI